MKRFQKMREQKGFTLIELAIVLVIIGIIIGAVLKGQDLIESARIKRFDNAMREWETAVWTYVDRKGTFPGDTDLNGIIGDTGTAASAGDDIRAAGFINDPDENPVTVGSLNFWVQFGNDGGVGGTVNPKNVMAICANADCTDVLTEDIVKYVESFDTIIDGVSNGADGSVICVTTITADAVPTSPNQPEDYLITAVDETTKDVCSTTSTGLVYYFDRGN